MYRHMTSYQQLIPLIVSINTHRLVQLSINDRNEQKLPWLTLVKVKSVKPKVEIANRNHGVWCLNHHTTGGFINSGISSQKREDIWFDLIEHFYSAHIHFIECSWRVADVLACFQKVHILRWDWSVLPLAHHSIFPFENFGACWFLYGSTILW
jgi:hypothetical protein